MLKRNESKATKVNMEKKQDSCYVEKDDKMHGNFASFRVLGSLPSYSINGPFI